MCNNIFEFVKISSFKKTISNLSKCAQQSNLKGFESNLTENLMDAILTVAERR